MVIYSGLIDIYIVFCILINVFVFITTFTYVNFVLDLLWIKLKIQNKFISKNIENL